MPVDSTAVKGRRQLRFCSFDELLADAQRLCANPDTRTLGNWPVSQLLAHVATAINASIDGIEGVEVKPPFVLRLLGPLLKRRVLKRGLPSGFKLAEELEGRAYPVVGSPQEAYEMLRAAIERTKRERMTARNPVFGQLTHEEWIRFHLQHAAMHLSFAVPAAD